MQKNGFRRGLLDGIPIAVGYLSVSFGFGITAVNLGLRIIEAVLISMTNLTSAGQVAGLSVIVAGGTLFEMALTQFVINMRYSLMGIAMTQKLERGYGTLHRLFTSFFITDEIFAVSVSRKEVIRPSYMYGLATLPYIGWASGTILGAVAGHILPDSLAAALGIAIYGMFVAIITPAAKKEMGVLITVLFAVIISVFIYTVPALSFISSGFRIIISGVVAALVAASLRPMEVEENE